MVAAPRLDGSNPLSALAAALRITQAALEASQAATFGAEVCYRVFFEGVVACSKMLPMCLQSKKLCLGLYLPWLQAFVCWGTS